MEISALFRILGQFELILILQWRVNLLIALIIHQNCCLSIDLSWLQQLNIASSLFKYLSLSAFNSSQPKVKWDILWIYVDRFSHSLNYYFSFPNKISAIFEKQK